MSASIARLQAWACRSPISSPVSTSFGVIRDRPAVFVRVEDRDGAFGWGEVFANWPAAGAEHRVNLVVDDIAPLLLGQSVDSPARVFERLERDTHIRALQCGEFGPFRQVIAGLDTAIWDLTARREGVPVHRLLGDDTRTHLPVYASGIHIDAADRQIDAARTAGITAFKVKVGFDLPRDAARVRELLSGLRPGERLFADANQAWSGEDASDFMRRIEGHALGWLEEPIRADMPPSAWQDVAAAGSTPLAGGENIAGLPDFRSAIEAGILPFIQSDVAKWGGITGCLEVARMAIGGGRTYCPHFLGGGIGLVASAHVLAAAGGPGLLEVDVNPNPLRDAFGLVGESMAEGRWTLSGAPGLGIDDLPREVLNLFTHTREAFG